MAIGGGTLTRTLQVVIGADASRFQAAMGGATKSADTMAAKLRRGIGRAAPIAAVGLGLVAFQAKQGVQGVMEDEKALNNLESTLKATGGAANITAKGFFRYANELQAATGVGADQITQGAAILGTFRNVRNEVGRGNKVFSRATELSLDLSKKMGTDLKSANIMLGKALDNPIKGVSALQRVGVGLTDQQKEQVKAFQESGDIMSAQKIILGALEGQVGGTAKAYGQTTAGQVDRASRAFEELQKALAGALLPIITTLAGWLTKLSTFMQENERVVKIAIIAFTGLAAAILAVAGVLKVMAMFAALSNPVTAIAVGIAAVTAGVILLWKRSGTFRQIVTGAWEAIQKIVETVVDIFDGPVKAAFDVIVNAAKALGKLLTGDFSGAWEAMKGVVRGVLDWVKSTILALPATILTAAVAIGSAIVNGIKNGVATLGNAVWDAIKGLPGNLLARVGAWLTGLAQIGSTVIGYIKSGATGLANAVWTNITNMPAALINKVGAWLSGLAEIGGKVIDYIKSGVTGLASAVWSNIKGFPSALWNKITGAGGWADTIKGWGSSIGGWIKDNFVSALKGIGGALKSAVLAPVRALSKWIVDKWPNVPGLPGPPQWLKNLSTAGLGKNSPAMALGGIVDRPMRAIIGEAGPEAVVPLSNPTGRRALADALREAGAGAAAPQAGPTVVLNVHGVMAADVREFAARLKPELDRVLVAGY